jgi:Xaa-Pro aminopeptidase
VTKNAFVKPGQESAKELMVDDVKPWEEFSAHIDRRRAEHPSLVFYTEQRRWGGPAQSNPGDLPPVDDPLQLWPQTLRLKWPGAAIKSASAAIMHLRSVKSAAEISVMRKVALVSAEALRAGIKGIRSGRNQREVEAEIVCQCIASGGEGPSFWPWVMSGPNARISGAMESLVDYRHANRVMKAGELVRVDVGCDVDFYKGDVGRTVPVSGTFTAEQREVWDLLVTAYRAGIAVMRDGVTTDSVASAAIAGAKGLARSLTTPLGKKAAQMMIDRTSGVDWHLHMCGLEGGEPGMPVLRAGMIIAFEPMIEIDGQAFYLEDMILITRDGYEILTKGLPTTSAEIETSMIGS